jgi:alpha-glucosidase
MLNLYRRGLALRRNAPWGEDAPFKWLDASRHALAFSRGPRFVCLTNFGAEPLSLPAGAELLLASSELEGGAVAADTTVWLRQVGTTSSEGQGKEGR